MYQPVLLDFIFAPQTTAKRKQPRKSPQVGERSVHPMGIGDQKRAPTCTRAHSVIGGSSTCLRSLGRWVASYLINPRMYAGGPTHEQVSRCPVVLDPLLFIPELVLLTNGYFMCFSNLEQGRQRSHTDGNRSHRQPRISCRSPPGQLDKLSRSILLSASISTKDPSRHCDS